MSWEAKERRLTVLINRLEAKAGAEGTGGGRRGASARGAAAIVARAAHGRYYGELGCSAPARGSRRVRTTGGLRAVRLCNNAWAARQMATRMGEGFNSRARAVHADGRGLYCTYSSKIVGIRQVLSDSELNSGGRKCPSFFWVISE